jgi:hypothetical protein
MGVTNLFSAFTQHSRNSMPGSSATFFLGLRPQEAWAEQIPPSLLARTFPIPYATLRNGALSERALVTLGRNDSVVGNGVSSRHTIS